jgi:non-ribosomal peptide synthase protein (TIGR01720 family)
VEQIFGTLLHGGELHLPERGVIDNVVEFREYLKQHEIQVINFVPGTLNELLGYGEKLTSLEAVIAGGEKLERSVQDRLREKGYRVHNHYGPTEVTVDALAGECTGGEVNLGSPIRNVACYVVDNYGRPVPVGVTGELYVSGAGVARGYLNQPELTAERFVEWPAGSGQRVYHTGDLARWLPEGRLEFAGRRDSQVKVRGFRIELGEIESRMKLCDGIRESVVVAIDGVNAGEKQLCVYFTADEEIPAAELRDILRRDLPDYMIPAFFVHLPVLPRLSNGKIDRASLLAPQQTVIHHKYTAPGNKTEEILLDIWSAVLGLPKEEIGIKGNFFELGGDSIKVIQITARLHHHHLKLQGGAVFLYPTIQELAGHVTGLVRVAEQGAVQGLVEFTPEQVRFFTAECGPRHYYNQAVMLYSAAGFAEEIVRAVFGKIIEHHDMLRAVYHRQDDHWVQEIVTVDGNVDLAVNDLWGNTEAKSRVTMAAERIQASFDLAHGPLIKLGLFRLDDGDRLLIVVHHLLVDGVSWRILLEDIDILYRQLTAGEPLQLPAKTDSFTDWAAALQQYAVSSILLRELEFWQEVERTAVDLLPCSPGGENLERDSSTVTAILTVEETLSLLGPAHRAFGTDVNDLLLAALAQAFYEVWGLTRVAVALEGHGREFIAGDLDVSRTVGWFTSVYPVILEAPVDRDMARHIKSTKDRLHRIPGKGIGHGILKFITPVEKRAGLEFRLQPQVSFNYLGQFDTDTRERSFLIAAESPGRSLSKDSSREFELDVSGLVANQCLQLSLTFGRQRISKASIEDVLRVFKNSVVLLTNFCCQKQEREMTTSDFDYKELSGEQLDTIFD